MNDVESVVSFLFLLVKKKTDYSVKCCHLSWPRYQGMFGNQGLDTQIIMSEDRRDLTSPNFTALEKLLISTHKPFKFTQTLAYEWKLQIWIIAVSCSYCYQLCRNPFSMHREIVGWVTSYTGTSAKRKILRPRKFPIPLETVVSDLKVLLNIYVYTSGKAILFQQIFILQREEMAKPVARSTRSHPKARPQNNMIAPLWCEFETP